MFEFRVYLLSKAIHIVAAATKNIGGIVYDALKFLHHILYHDAPPTTHIKHMVYDIWFIYVCLQLDITIPLRVPG